MELSSFIGHARSTVSINQILRNQLLWMLLLRVVLYTMLLAINYIFRGAQFDVIVLPTNLLILLLLIVFLTTIFSAFFLLIYQGNLRKFGFAQNLMDTCFVSMLVFFSGSSMSIFTTVYFFPIVAGGLILPRKGGLLAAAAASLQYGAILALEAYGLYPVYLQEFLPFTDTPPMVILNHFAVHGLTFFLAAILSALFGVRLQKTENALSDSLKNFDRLAILYKQIFDNISTGIITIDPDHIITSANNAVGKITSLPPHSLVGKRVDTTFPGLDLASENERLTTDFMKTDGSKVRIGYAHMNIQESEVDPGFQAGPHKIITLRDISEIEKLERQVRQTEKLAAIGMMSASIAHDFRNPLTAISGSAQVLLNEFSSEGIKNYTNFQLTGIILRESNRLIETIGDFLKFSRPEHAACSWFSLRNCFEEVLQVGKADPVWPETAKIVFDFNGAIDIWADRKQMFTVFNHLIQNALAFCPIGHERITVRAAEINGDDNLESIEISIKDNGPGVDESKMDQIFEPFYTTRPDGTGLGLAIVRQTMTEHRGSIAVTNDAKGGAVFTLILPLPQ
jgi:two-component system sensor histidine kinase PilS (NtrC family)